MKNILISFLLVTALILSGCDTDTTYQLELADTSKPYTVVNSNTIRFVDEEAGVVCWVYSHQTYKEGGISCLPIDMTDLGE